ncbi:MAG: Uma2 family endonuclease [bacterium]
MNLPAYKTEIQTFTYADYLNWPDDERWELIDGVAYDMSPAPSREHQRISGELFKQIAVFLTGKKCEAYFAPFDVRLPREEDDDEDQIIDVVQPDIVVVCDPAKLDSRGCKSGPDFVIEIISPATASKDQIKKVVLYERSKVKEYWIVHPSDKIITVRLLGKYDIPKIYEGKGELQVVSLPGLTIDLNEVFR